jgi:DNA-directed RNA polymerase specialized sigma24 family protein
MSSSDADLLAAFVAALPASATAPEPAVLGPALAAVVARGCAACPEVAPIALAGYLGRRCPGGAVLDHLEALDGEELALAWACADGASAAIARFEARYFGELRVGVARLGLTADELAEVTQEVRRMLFADEPPRLLGLTARGELRALLRLMAVRAAISARRRAGRAPLVDDGDDPLGLLDDAPSPSAQVARAQHREALRGALAVALAALSPPRPHDLAAPRPRWPVAGRPRHHAPRRSGDDLAMDRGGARADLPRDPARAHRPARGGRRRLR